MTWLDLFLIGYAICLCFGAEIMYWRGVAGVSDW